MKRILRTSLALAGLSLVGCAGDIDADATQTTEPVASAQTNGGAACTRPTYAARGPALAAFEDFAELDGYVAAATAECYPLSPPRSRDFAMATTQRLEPDADGTAAVTSNAERSGDVLLVSQSDRLFAVDVSTPGAPRLRDAQYLTSRAAAKQVLRELELRVVGDVVYVLRKIDDFAGAGMFGGPRLQRVAGVTQAGGLSYVAPWPGLAVTAFRLRDGSLVRVGEWFIESVDTRYALDALVKVVDGRLAFYVGHEFHAFRADAAQKYRYAHATLPRILPGAALERGSPGRPLLEARDVHRPLASVRNPKLHAVAHCGLDEKGELACRAKGWIGERLGQVHVSDTHAYVWTQSHVYAAGHDPFTLGAHRVSGTPTSSRSLKEVGDTLHAAVTTAQPSSVTLGMWSLPRSAFDARGEQDDAALTQLAITSGRSAQLDGEAFVGSTYLASLYTFFTTEHLATRVVYDVATRAAPRTEVVAKRAYQIEPLGADRALLVSSQTDRPDESTLSLDVWTLAGTPAQVASLVLPETRPAAAQSRFLVRQAGDATRTRFAVPLARRVPDSGTKDDVWLGLFELHERELKLIGAPVPPRTGPHPATPCVGLCGTTLFAAEAVHFGERVLAQRGDVLVEIGLDPLAELARLQLTPPSQAAP